MTCGSSIKCVTDRPTGQASEQRKQLVIEVLCRTQKMAEFNLLDLFSKLLLHSRKLNYVVFFYFALGVVLPALCDVRCAMCVFLVWIDLPVESVINANFVPKDAIHEIQEKSHCRLFLKEASSLSVLRKIEARK